MLIELDSKLVAQECLYLALILQTSNWEKVGGLWLSPLSYVCHNLKTKSTNIKLPFSLQTRANLVLNIFCKLLFVFWMGEKSFQLYLSDINVSRQVISYLLFVSVIPCTCVCFQIEGIFSITIKVKNCNWCTCW